MTVNVLLAAADESWEISVVRVLQQPGSGMTLVRRCIDVADVVATAASGRADAALLSARLRGLDTDVLDRLVEGGAFPVLMTDPDDGTQADRVARLSPVTGDAAVLSWPDITALPSLLAARNVERSDAELLPPEREVPFAEPTGQAGRLVAVWGPTGAPGRSTVALGLAAACAQRRHATLLVDADVYGGALASMLAVLDEISGVLAAARLATTGSLDLASMRGQVRELGPYLRILTGLPRADRWPQLRPGALSQILSTAQHMAPLVIVDCGFCLEQDEDLAYDTAAPRRNGCTLLAIERSDLVVAVGSADPLGLSRLARGVLDLREAVPGVDAAMVVNRMRPRLGWSREQVAEVLCRFTGCDPVAFLPEDRQATDRAAVEGKTLVECAPSSPLTLALDQLASEVSGVPASTRGRAARRQR